MIQQQQWEELVQLGIELSTYKNLDLLLKKIAQDSIRIVDCEGASIYIKHSDFLNFMITQNIVLEKKMGNLENRFRRFSLPISSESIAGYVAKTKEILNIPNAYQIDKQKPYHFLDDFDKMSGYKTVSILTLPMLDNKGELIGVLQLVNNLKEGKISPFEEQDIFIARYFSSIAAMAIKNASFDEILKKSYHETVYRLAVASEFRDLETSHHIRRMSEYCAIIYRKLGYNEEEVENVKYASQMHDIGKIGIPDRILQKPGPLSPDERQIMETHTTIGAKILENSSSPLIQLSAIVALSHHEKWDGTGYPQRLKGEQIPLIGRVVALADVFDALTSKRVYKPAFDIDKVLRMIKEGRGFHFDPKIVDIFMGSISEILAIYEKYRE